MPNKEIYDFSIAHNESQPLFNLRIYPSGVKIFQEGKFRFFVVEDNQLKEVYKEELFQKVKND